MNIFPTWRDVDIPLNLVQSIKAIKNNYLMHFLVDDRVYREENAVYYVYACSECGTTKTIQRQYEEYNKCCKCGSIFVRGGPYWKNCRESIKSNLDPNGIVSQMSANYENYFSKKFENIIEVEWDVSFYVKFVGGEKVRDFNISMAIAKAAVLCPFLWDSQFNWRDCIHNDSGGDLHLTHLIMQWSR